MSARTRGMRGLWVMFPLLAAGSAAVAWLGPRAAFGGCRALCFIGAGASERLGKPEFLQAVASRFRRLRGIDANALAGSESPRLLGHGSLARDGYGATGPGQPRLARAAARLPRDAIEAWLDERTSTPRGRNLSLQLFGASSKKRLGLAFKGVATLAEALQEEAKQENGVSVGMIKDSMFLAVHLFAGQADAWLGADAWPSAVMLHASLPGLGSEEVARAMLRELPPTALSAEEVTATIDAFLRATWGEGDTVVQIPGVEGVMISAMPQFAGVQYTIGVLWGYALRGLILRLALDRATGTMPTSAAEERKRLEKQFKTELGSGGEESEGSEAKAQPSLTDYAAEFFGHKEWASLCQPSDAAVAILETELEEALPALAMLAGADLDEDGEVAEGGGQFNMQILGDEAEDEMEDEEWSEEDLEDMEEEFGIDESVLLEYETWLAFQRRGIALGALVADAEAFVEGEAGALARGGQVASAWMTHLVNTGALTGMRREQGAMIANRLKSPLQRLASVMKTNFLVSKLRSAREGLNRLYGKLGSESSSAS